MRYLDCNPLIKIGGPFFVIQVFPIRTVEYFRMIFGISWGKSFFLVDFFYHSIHAPLQSEINDDHVYREPEYSRDDHIQLWYCMDYTDVIDIHLNYAGDFSRDEMLCGISGIIRSRNLKKVDTRPHCFHDNEHFMPHLETPILLTLLFYYEIFPRKSRSVLAV